MMTNKIDWHWEDETGQEIDIICEWYAEPAEPRTWDYPGCPACFIVESITDEDGNDLVERISDSDWEHIERAIEDHVTDSDQYDGP